MAVPSNRSPSPLSSRRIYQPRNSDSNSAPRRSFSGNQFLRPSVLSNPRNLNPVTPANSPAGFGRQNSLGNSQGCDEKENEKDHTPKLAEAARSPANGSKNFMAPTISATSKFTPSPRKKVLVERNDPVRTSISLSEGKATFFSAISSEIVEDLDQKDGQDSMESSVSNLGQIDAVSEVLRVSKTSKKVTFLEGPSGSDVTTGFKPETVTISSDDCSGVDSVSKNSPSCLPVSPIIAPLDADPSLPPYDPKTNFLSPRPQFLHYKPNPRIEILLNKENELELGKPKRLEDNFMLDVLSENFLDTEFTEGSSSEDSQKGSEDSSSSENLLPERKEDELHVSESINTSSQVTSEGILDEKEGEKVSSAPESHGISEVNFEQEKEETFTEAISQDVSKEVVYDIGRPKPSFFKILTSVSLLLLLFVAGVSMWVTISPFTSSSVLDTLKSPKIPDTSEIGLWTKENFHQIGARFQKLSFDSISPLSLLTNKLGRGDNLGHVQFMNLTYVEDDAVCNCFEEKLQSLALTGDLEEEDVEEEEEESIAEHIVEPAYPEMVSDESDERELEDVSELGTEELAAPAKLAEISKSRSLETFWEAEEASSSNVDTELKGQEDSEDVIFPVKVDSDGIETDYSEAQVVSSSADPEPESTSETVHSLVVEDASSEMLQDLSSQILESPASGSVNKEPTPRSVWGIASLVFALVSAAAFMYWKQSISSNPNFVVHTDGLSDAGVNPASAVPEKTFHYRPAHQNCVAEVDVAEESCSSEMSSFQRSSSYSRKDLRGAAANEVQSQDRKSRKYSKRESLASSSEFSTGSPSYGSFTTYERISGKQAIGDDEIMTPVRRSSRIRNQVTSP